MGLAVRLWHGISTELFYHVEISYPVKTLVTWRNDQSLLGLILKAFPRSGSLIPSHGRRLDSAITAVSLEEVRVITCSFTSNLQDHLQLVGIGKYRTLYVSPRKPFLDHAIGATSSASIPQEFAAETLRALDILFPADDLETRKLLLQADRLLLASRSSRSFHHPGLELDSLCFRGANDSNLGLVPEVS
jgi:hypothetical protein